MKWIDMTQAQVEVDNAGAATQLWNPPDYQFLGRKVFPLPERLTLLTAEDFEVKITFPAAITVLTNQVCKLLVLFEGEMYTRAR